MGSNATLPAPANEAIPLGVDIFARWFDLAGKGDVRRFPNTPEGIAGCLAWPADGGRHGRPAAESRAARG